MLSGTYSTRYIEIMRLAKRSNLILFYAIGYGYTTQMRVAQIYLF